MHQPKRQKFEQHYARARELLQANPGLGKKTLARQLGIHPPYARCLIQRFRGETEGHNVDPVYARVRAVCQAHPDWRAPRVAQELGVTLDIAQVHLARLPGVRAREQGQAEPPPASVPDSPPPDEPALPTSRSPELQDSVQGEHRDLSYRGSRIQSLDDLLVYAQVDNRIWEVERFVINKWEPGAKDPVTGEILTAPLFQIKAWLRRRVVERAVADLLGGMLQAFREAAPERPAGARVATAARGLLEVSLMDLHLGKLAWAPGSGRGYSPEVAEQMFWGALEDLLAKASGCRPAEILFVAGNDFFNTDTLGRTTTAGTPQDEAVRWQDSFIRGRQLLIRAIDRLRAVAAVRVVMVQGNHDTQRLYYLGEVLAAWFARTPGVQVDNGPRQRKYVHFGSNLIGFTHGNHERHPQLPLLMAMEQPGPWSRSRHREFHLGHWHTKRHKMFVPADDQAGVLVRIIPSLCPADAWHASMGYSSKLAAEAYYWDPEDGCVATFTHNPP